MSLSVVIITKNEEKNIRRCLDSVKWADEIVLIDSQSTDRTVEIAKDYGAIVFSPEWKGYGPAKQEGVNKATGEWILSIDADEEVTPELSKEIKETLSSEESYDGYLINRHTNFMGKWINHCGWYPDYLLRLFRKDKGNFNDAVIHEQVVLDGRTRELKAKILHYSYPNMETYLERFNRYTTMGAEAAFANGKKARNFDIVFRPFVSFIDHFITHQGFQDGLEGFIISVMSSVAVMVKYVKLRHLQKIANRSERNV
jgi:glycosyltransferase involved in cell wall biosynthesis